MKSILIFLCEYFSLRNFIKILRGQFSFSYFSNSKHSAGQIQMLVVVQSLSCVRLFATPWTVAHQALLSMGFPRQEYWSGLPFPPPGTLPDPVIEPKSLASPALAGGFFTTKDKSKFLEHLFFFFQNKYLIMPGKLLKKL